jgi:uncharacterized protein (TIGR02001 family)
MEIAVHRLALTVLAAALAIPTSTLAQDIAGEISFDFAVGTDNRSKGASKSEGDPFGLAGIEWSSSDFYVVAEGETVDHANGSQLEAEINAGWRPEAAGFAFDFNAAHKWYLDANPGTEDEAWEFTADVSRSLTDRVDARLRLQYSPDSAGSTRSWNWVEVRGRVEVHERVRVSAAIGRREQVNSRDYTAWNVGADFRINDHARLDLRWYDTDVANPSTQYEDALVAVLNLGF